MIDSSVQELLIICRMLQGQLDSRIGELEWLIIRAESQCGKEMDLSITSSGKNQILSHACRAPQLPGGVKPAEILNQSAPWVSPELL